MYDLIIIGTGPAGLTASIYASRAKLDALVIEKEPISGGQVLNTYEVDNYPGLMGISGYDLSQKFREHADKLSANIITEEIVDISIDGKVKQVSTSEETFFAKTIVIATGAKWKKLGVKGEEELQGMGVSYCATCDGAFFKNREVCVVGGGDVAVEDAIFLSRACKKVYLIHRRNELRAAKALQEAMRKIDNIEIIWDSVVEQINGTDMVESVSLRNIKTNQASELVTNGIFIAVGIEPNKNIFDGKLEQDERGYIVADESGATSVNGVYAIGDVRTKSLRQIVTAVADGANVITSVEKYLYTY